MYSICLDIFFHGLNANKLIMKTPLTFIKKTIRNIAVLVTYTLITLSASVAQMATVDVDRFNPVINDNPSLLLGITFDARTSLTANSTIGQIGYYNANGTIIPAVDTLMNNFPMSTLRYPGNGIATGFNWKKSIGPVGSRPNQNLLGGIGSPQPVNFGFDEFMAMTAAKGVTPDNIQIMVPIYDSAATGLTFTQTNAAIANMIANNADWVEYCNAPNDGSNPGGGIDWAAQRASNGHPLPYDIKIWNIGNEPWTSQEFGSTATDCNNYITAITPIIDAMLAIDSTLKITLPTTGNPTSTTSWANALLNSTLVAQGKVYALSPHYFPTESTTPAVAPSKGVVAVENALNTLISAANAKGLKVFVGDYAHYIASPNPSNSQKDSAMQWMAANFEADLLLMLSQKAGIERANFWVYGNAQATWHPIRYNSVNNYTLMPAAELYKILFPAFLDKSISIVSTSPVASDLNPYAVRSGAFISADGLRINIISVNRDKIDTMYLQVANFNYGLINNARLFTAPSLTSEMITESVAAIDQFNFCFILPPMSIIIAEYALNTVGIQESMIVNNSFDFYPNPASEDIHFKSIQPEFEIYNSIGQIVVSKQYNLDSFSIKQLKDGLYYIKTNSKYYKLIVKH
jgi:hypothetical protein